ncbi:MAG TPA: glycoside hydrolase family 16 protein [Candidatus Mediterraneibacter surreyensis]|nr:glycoside hydrolase family 16 protein [Candidatus Mediterraneibacter surreyensis]
MCGENHRISEKINPGVIETMKEENMKQQEESMQDNTILSYKGYKLIWEEQFRGDVLNRNDWNVELHEPGWVNNELQEYVDSSDNIYVRNGKLVLKPIRRTNEDGSVSYTSGRVNTQYKHDFKYGIFEARARVPEGRGFLPAFWMMPTEEDFYGQWPRCGEIDIMEVLGNDTKTSYGTLHFGTPHCESQGSYTLKEETFSDSYHLFAVEWKKEKILWYVDGKLIHTENNWYSATESEGKKPYPAPFDQPFYIILNLAVGGNWPGSPDESTDIENAEFCIDYVKVYEKV